MPSLAHRPRLRATTLTCTLLLLVGTACVLGATAARAALPDTSSPELELERTIRTAPFAGSSTSTKDNEGSAYVPKDDSLWVADDDGRAVYEINRTTGALKQTITRSALEAARPVGGGSAAGTYRTRDLESMAYDSSSDTLYLFSGTCCTSASLPTAYRLRRNSSGAFRVESFQPLPSGTDFTAAAWHPTEKKLYTGLGSNLRTYDYATNKVGSSFQISGLTGIFGMSFSSDGSDLFVARSSTRLSRVTWSTKSLRSGWTFDLSGFGMLDPRAVEIIDDRFYVSDGYDFRAAGDPLSHAIFVLGVRGSTSSAPTASFTASPLEGPAPLTVQFTDTSTGSPTSWRWQFGDGSTTSKRSPSHTYVAAGTYTVKLTVSNAAGQSVASGKIVVGQEAPEPNGNLIGNAGFETSTSGWDDAGNAAVRLERVTGGHSGSWSARLTNTSSGPVTTTLNDAPNWVQTSARGTYAGSVWVRSDTPGAKAYLRIREFRGSTKVNEAVVGVKLTTSWQRINVSLTPVDPGATTLDFATVVYSAPAGTHFYADDASLSLS